ncbi:MAG: hypothetical protein PHQ43_07905 [Dehalococcoidales bacterium]|nr:hypothetical protein [Dehalococcoidales bacterium]
MKTMLNLKRFDRNWKLLEERSQPSRSWTLGMLQMLYTSHLQFTSAAPYAGPTNVDRTIMPIDTESGPATLGYTLGLNRVVAPSGHSATLAVSGNWNEYMFGPGSSYGIQVGTDNTAATPTDKRLGRRIGHGRRAADGGDVAFESFTTDDAGDLIYDVLWKAQQFIPQTDHQCRSVDLKLYKVGAPPNDLTVEIRGYKFNAAGGNMGPSDVVLATGTVAAAGLGAAPGAVVNCAFGTPVDLYAGHRYYIVARTVGGAAGNSYGWRYDSTGFAYRAGWIQADGYSNFHLSPNSGATWTTTSQRCRYFTEYGRSQGEFEHGGTEVTNLVIANPNASFDIRKFFTNNSGGAITVNEVGIQSLGCCHVSALGGHIYPVLIAHDVVAPGIAVANTEIILVTYTPSITV